MDNDALNMLASIHRHGRETTRHRIVSRKSPFQYGLVSLFRVMTVSAMVLGTLCWVYRSPAVLLTASSLLPFIAYIVGLVYLARRAERSTPTAEPPTPPRIEVIVDRRPRRGAR